MNLVHQQTQAWLQQWVIKLNLCPFAAKVVNEQSVRIAVSQATTERALIASLLGELELIQQADASEISTSLLVFDSALHDFDEYLEFADLANDLLIDVGLEGLIQIATFHPDYCFDGVDHEDVSNYSNRSPYPMLHFIREQQLEAAIASYPNAEHIPDHNIALLQSMGEAKVLSLLAAISERYQRSEEPN